MEPNLSVDPWERPYLDDLNEIGFRTDLTAWTDAQAWWRWPKMRWVYNKYQFLSRMGEKAEYAARILTVDNQDFYPLILKPCVNLEGMGRGVRRVNGPGEVPDSSDWVVQEIYSGPHISTDFFIMGRKVYDSRSFLCMSRDESFRLFEAIPEIEPKALKAVFEILDSGFSNGFVNMETIGGHAIEAHLRPSLQFYDICGGLIEQGARALHRGVKDFKRSGFSEGYSMVWRRKEDAKVRANDKDRACAHSFHNLPLGVSSSQFCFDDGDRLSEWPQDEISFRYLVVNGTDPDAIREYGDEVSGRMSFEEVTSGVG